MSRTAPLHVTITTLHELPPSNVNRDDTGAPKMTVFGGQSRISPSSQSQKRPVRLQLQDVFDDPALRTRRMPELIGERLVKEHGWEDAWTATRAGLLVILAAGFKGLKASTTGKGANTKYTGETNTALFLVGDAPALLAAIAARHSGVLQAATDKDLTAAAKKADDDGDPAEAKGVISTIAAADRDEIRRIVNRSNKVISLFGRMLADDPGSRVDGAVQVAFGLGTHAADEQEDYYTAVDDITAQRQDQPGAGFLDVSLHTAGVVRRWASVDLNELASNLAKPGVEVADPYETALELTAAFLRTFALTLPRAKRRTHAAEVGPDLVHVSMRTDQPVDYAGAWSKPVADSGEGWMGPSIERYNAYVPKMNKVFGLTGLASHGHVTTADQDLDNLGQRHEGVDALISKILNDARAEQATRREATN
ncbi:type I-E CRISPR-associated protein Cas7/Cse4/CasC [Streptomyces sp. NPDC021098]|uniref:type I-E CRISPR-associated protein Cas7/Cse4/CasC n=1 Tax=unclassified Streptomyces TaxID=2593676 RepID=UPI003798C35A